MSGLEKNNANGADRAGFCLDCRLTHFTRIKEGLPVIRSLLTLPTVQSFDAHAIDARNSSRPV